jgi:diguanylate cyclase (GGDEF)-like protein
MRRLETALTLVFSAVVGALLALAPGPVEAAPLTALVVVAYALAGQVQIPVGTGAVIPTQLFLVPLFGLASPQLVPALVVLGIALSLAADIGRGRFGRDRLLFAGGDAIHALGPALVLVAAGSPALTEASAFVLVAAFAAQLSLDYATSLVRVRIATGVRPQLQLRVQAHVWAVDAGLAPAGLLSLHALQSLPWAPLALLPLVGLAALTASDRTRRIERAHARLEALQRERHRLRLAVQRIGDAFASNLDLDALLQIVTRAAVEALDADGGRASIYRGDGRRLLRRATVKDLDLLESAVDVAARRALELRAPAQARCPAGTALACPVGDGAMPTGVVCVARRSEGFADEERALLAYLCEQAGVATGNVVRHETLHRQALTDELTGLANHRRFQEILTAAIERREEAPVALVLLDLDDFKQVNDTHGHQIGDTVLAAVGHCLREECRATDEPARYGGEELAVVLSDATLEEAAELAERLRRTVRGLQFTGPAGEPLRVTVSAGVASLSGDIASRSDLMAAADGALYAAKAGGKDRVAVARTPARPPQRSGRR